MILRWWMDKTEDPAADTPAAPAPPVPPPEPDRVPERDDRNDALPACFSPSPPPPGAAKVKS